VTAAPAFPGYRVLDVLGQGGMGQVYLAEDEMLGRKVAIKTILPAVAGAGEHRARFLREARAMATVEHPRVVRVYSFGEAAGQAYFVMELIEGETLAARLHRTPQLAVDEALRVAREVAEALAAAWDRGIVHRDVKPGNIILDREGHAHVADFGLARPAETDTDPSITREGAFVGSPHYVAPEQVRAAATDFRTDIYSLGIVLYEMLAGRRPFEGKSTMEVVSRQLTEPTPPLRTFAPQTPDPVAQLVRTMTEKDPTLRPASYPALIASLSGTLPGNAGSLSATALPTSSMPTVAFPAAIPVPLARPPRPRWLTAGVPVAVLAVVIAGYLLRDRLGRTPRPAGDLVVALAPFYAADDESSKEAHTLATLVESELKRVLGDEEGRAVGLVTAPGPARSAREARRLGERASADVVLWGEVLAFKGDVEVQPALTPVSAGRGILSPKLGTQLLEQGGSPLEVRRKGAMRLAEAVARLATKAALDRGSAETALALLRECRPSAETLDLRAAIFDKLGRGDEAAAARRDAEALRN
jgi:hypothetical protein